MTILFLLLMVELIELMILCVNLYFVKTVASTPLIFFANLQLGNSTIFLDVYFNIFFIEHYCSLYFVTDFQRLDLYNFSYVSLPYDFARCMFQKFLF